ncbi:MAG: winged helix-turn-helix domain-containing protein, partial [Nanoarchaeota archaeon]|nr:winged helix-turn-helix domain-containing protein [Nanoarchaeota archaeon]
MIIRNRYQRITIIRSEKPNERNVNNDLQWFGTSLGLFNLRDKDKSCFRVFIELIRAAKKQEPISSDEIAARLKLSRATVIHHINKLTDSGFVAVEKNRYILRVSNLRNLVDELSEDAERTLKDLREIA